MKLTLFKEIDFLNAVKTLFKELNVPINYVADEPTTAKEILKDTYKANSTFALVDDVYFVGMVDDAAFEGNQSLSANQIKSDYDGVLIFGITLNHRENNLLPTRSQLAEISRAFNREFYYTPVVLVFKYQNDDSDYLAFANTERLKYKQEWREGEKVGKVSLLRDININNIHSGHERIINELKIPISGIKKVDSFAKLYNYWQEVFSVSLLNKKFYQDLSNWYFWAIKHVTFPNKPNMAKVLVLTGKTDEKKLEELINEHNAQNVIRLLTRLLFTWFIKEKKLIPEELFDIDSLQKDILNEISPYHEEGTMFAEANKDSIFYKAILQNLFFASLNCPIEADGTDNRTRGFRGLESYGKHRGIDWMMRYKKYFKNPDAFLKMMNDTVPFLNGGLFECLDDKTQNLYIDGFSDQMTKGELLIVPDFLFFGVEENVDLSQEYGVKNRGAKQAAVKGLINILKSYKFTITENTPIEEDVALDPELLGKVFENLLASYNPETKTTARKQTGSFYTPREIVNYMVDESLIAYLKNAVSQDSKREEFEENELDEKLHQLASFDSINPFDDDPETTKALVNALDKAKILDPAVGSGAFPMGVLQKMVHLLQKLDSDNELWKEVQLEKAMAETEDAFGIEDKKEREQKLIEINNAFDKQINDPDFARKLYLIENCIYGVDIQPIATQISKLRFFISLVVDQKTSDDKKSNFGIRPLPNLETKFVTANTLIGIQKENTLFYTDEVKKLENELKKIRHKLFDARTKETKLKYRQKDLELRNQISDILKDQGLPLDDAEKLAGWDPYDQNASSPFFDPEWMFDIKSGFDVVIGNPPYLNVEKIDKSIKEKIFLFKTAYQKYDLYVLFYEKGIHLLNKNGIIIFITSNKFLSQAYGLKLRQEFLQHTIQHIINFNYDVFESATVRTSIVQISNSKPATNSTIKIIDIETKGDKSKFDLLQYSSLSQSIFNVTDQNNFRINLSNEKISILNEIELDTIPVESICSVNYGLRPSSEKLNLKKEAFIYENNDKDYKAYFEGKNMGYWLINNSSFLNYKPDVMYNPMFKELFEYEKLVGIRTLSDIGKLRFIFDNEGYYCNDSVVVLTLWHKFSDVKYLTIKRSITHEKIKLSEKFSYEYLQGILNSKLIKFYVNELLYDGTHFYPNHMKQLPIKNNTEYQNIFNTLIPIIRFLELRNIKHINAFTKLLDALVFNLYFPDHVQEREINVFEFVEQNIENVMQGREFDDLSDTEKEEVIEQLHKTWTDPDNEVRNRMKLFAVRSPEILKPILES